MKDSFSPTHQVNPPFGNPYLVQVVDGAAYSREEWDNSVQADLELVNGEWNFLGEPFLGSIESMPKVKGE